MSPEFARALNELRLSSQFCDAKIVLEDGTEYLLHRNILSSCSDYFRALFTTELKPCGLSGEMATTILPWISKYTMNQIIDYAYTRNIDINMDNVCDLYVAADFLCIHRAVTICVDYIKSNIDEENCVRIMDFAFEYFNYPLINEAEKYLLYNFRTVSKVNTDLLNKPLEYILDMFASENLYVICEEEVWEFAMRWIREHELTRKYQLSTLMKEIRLGLLDEQYFRTKVLRNPLVQRIYSCRCIAESAEEFFQRLQRLPKQDYDFVTPKLAQPRKSRSVLFAVGGWSGGSPTSVIESYDAKADRWKRLPESDGAMARAYHGTAILNQKLYIIGGFEGREYFNSCRCYDLNTKIWTFIAPMISRRCYVSVAVLGGFIYALGGFDGHTRQMSAERYNPVTNQWNAISAMNVPRSDADATVLHNKIYITGGFNGHDCISSAEVYDPQSDVWTLIVPMSSRRSGVSCIAYRGCIYAIGGFNGIIRLKTAERYEPQTDRWTAIAPLYIARSNFAVELIDDVIMVMGGFDGTTTVAHVESFDIRLGFWCHASELQLHRSALSACATNVPFDNINEYLVENREDLLDEKRRRIAAVEAELTPLLT